MSTKTIGIVGAGAIVVLIAVITLLGGGEDEAAASQTDGAFLTGMVAHHEMAIEMAEMAQEDAEHRELRQLADDIVAAQSAEIETIGTIHQRLFDQPVSSGAHGDLGLDAETMGMNMDMAALETADPFDREFIDMMVSHHRGAIAMAQIELDQGSDQETKDLASTIIKDQSREIEQMNAWREEWYGSPSPSGGVPAEDEFLAPAPDSMEGMDH